MKEHKPFERYLSGSAQSSSETIHQRSGLKKRGVFQTIRSNPNYKANN